MAKTLQENFNNCFKFCDLYKETEKEMATSL